MPKSRRNLGRGREAGGIGVGVDEAPGGESEDEICAEDSTLLKKEAKEGGHEADAPASSHGFHHALGLRGTGGGTARHRNDIDGDADVANEGEGDFEEESPGRRVCKYCSCLIFFVGIGLFVWSRMMRGGCTLSQVSAQTLAKRGMRMRKEPNGNSKSGFWHFWGQSSGVGDELEILGDSWRCLRDEKIVTEFQLDDVRLVCSDAGSEAEPAVELGTDLKCNAKKKSERTDSDEHLAPTREDESPVSTEKEEEYQSDKEKSDDGEANKDSEEADKERQAQKNLEKKVQQDADKQKKADKEKKETAEVSEKKKGLGAPPGEEPQETTEHTETPEPERVREDNVEICGGQHGLMSL